MKRKCPHSIAHHPPTDEFVQTDERRCNLWQALGSHDEGRSNWCCGECCYVACLLATTDMFGHAQLKDRNAEKCKDRYRVVESKQPKLQLNLQTK